MCSDAISTTMSCLEHQGNETAAAGATLTAAAVVSRAQRHNQTVPDRQTYLFISTLQQIPNAHIFLYIYVWVHTFMYT